MSSIPMPPAATPQELTPAACAQRLKELFPALFNGPPKPLKLRIQADIQERAPGVFTKQMLSAFLRRHTGSTSYLVALSKATQRFDLDGQACGELSDEHRKAAADELLRRRQLHESRRELEEQQRRNRAALLRDFQNTTLTPANFCALKGVAVEELDGLLEIARREAHEEMRGGPKFPHTPSGGLTRSGRSGGTHEEAQGQGRSKFPHPSRGSLPPNGRGEDSRERAQALPAADRKPADRQRRQHQTPHRAEQKIMNRR